MRCPRPCLARNATLRPSSVPHTYASEGAPNGVFTRTSFTRLSPGIEYSPLPPMIPISACATDPPENITTQSQTRDYTRCSVRPYALCVRRRRSQFAVGADSLRVLCGRPPRSLRLKGPTRYNLPMRSRLLLALALATAALAQNATTSEPKSVTIPITLDHNRVVIDVYLPLPDGTTKRIRGWVDNGNADLEMSRRAATLMALNVACDDKSCTAPPPAAIMLRDAKNGDMKISLAHIKEAKIPLKPVSAATVMVPGMSAEINLPASV